jgi:two-component system, cell cycle response regulator DivK
VKKILIVDDHPDMRKVLQIQIELMGFAGITAKNGKEGVATAIAEKPDLIMMDFMMPEMDGWEATRILRASSETKEIPIIAVTAMVHPSDVRSCIEAGCNDYLAKPFRAEELRKRIEALIQRKHPASGI